MKDSLAHDGNTMEPNDVIAALVEGFPAFMLAAILNDQNVKIRVID